ncbi:MAG: hypothetical protein GWN86_12160, partial [Desulfobacterales bacterium]|nr:hypothetical protein [Desulfobacterales bacterium]
DSTGMYTGKPGTVMNVDPYEAQRWANNPGGYNESELEGTNLSPDFLQYASQFQGVDTGALLKLFGGTLGELNRQVAGDIT